MIMFLYFVFLLLAKAKTDNFVSEIELETMQIMQKQDIYTIIYKCVQSLKKYDPSNTGIIRVADFQYCMKKVGVCLC